MFKKYRFYMDVKGTLTAFGTGNKRQDYQGENIEYIILSHS